jgi:hypothetical protein
MAAFLRRWRLAGLVTFAVVTCGCNLISLPYFLLFGTDNRNPPECRVFDAPKEEIKVAILTSLGPETRAEFLRFDRDLAEQLAQYLRLQYKEAKAKVVLVPPNEVENYKDSHPNWQLDLAACGNHLHADYLVTLELDKLSLYLANSSSQWFQGQAMVSVKVMDVKKIDEGPIYRHEFSYQYPTRGPQLVMDNPNPLQFRADFLGYLVRELSRCFASYTPEQKYACEE